jgi:hypothetical protein
VISAALASLFLFACMPPQLSGPIGPQANRGSIACTSSCHSARRAMYPASQAEASVRGSRPSSRCCVAVRGASLGEVSGAADYSTADSRNCDRVARALESDRLIARTPHGARTRRVCSAESGRSHVVFSPTARANTRQVLAESARGVPRNSSVVSSAYVKNSHVRTTSATL